MIYGGGRMRIEGMKAMCAHLQMRFQRAVSSAFLYEAVSRSRGDNPLPSGYAFGKRTIDAEALDNWYKVELERMEERHRTIVEHRRRERDRLARAAPTRANRR